MPAPAGMYVSRVPALKLLGSRSSLLPQNGNQLKRLLFLGRSEDGADA